MTPRVHINAVRAATEPRKSLKAAQMIEGLFMELPPVRDEEDIVLSNASTAPTPVARTDEGVMKDSHGLPMYAKMTQAAVS